jgi:hypothetical protein
MSIGDLWSMLGDSGPILGPVFVVVVFFLWKDWKREARMQKQIDKLEADQKEVTRPLLKECVAVIAQNTVVMTRLERMMDRMLFVQGSDERCVLDRLLHDANEHRGE